MRPAVPALLSLNGGYVDTVGAALVLGTSGVVAKLLALPVFCLVIVVTRLLSFRLPPSRVSSAAPPVVALLSRITATPVPRTATT